MEIICVPVIAAVVFAVMEIYKKATGGRESWKRFIPIISGVLGIVGGIVCFYAFPTVIAAGNVFVASFIGCASGLSATGCNQIFKQLTKYGVKVKEDSPETAVDAEEVGAQ